MTREEHVAWCKQRALEYLEPGKYFSPTDAVASMISDLGKHDDTREMMERTSPLTALALQSTGDAESARRFIEGFN